MKYELLILDNHAEGFTAMQLKHNIYMDFAVIPWAKGQKSTLHLHPTNIPEVPPHIAAQFNIVPKDVMPALDKNELITIVDTVASKTTEVQAQNRQTFKYR